MVAPRTQFFEGNKCLSSFFGKFQECIGVLLLLIFLIYVPDFPLSFVFEGSFFGP